jgi:hypothetical protein
MTSKQAKTGPLPPYRQAHLLGVCLSILISVAPLRAQDSQEKIAVDDVSRTFAVHLPKGYDVQQHYPVVILLHGRNQDADDMARLTHFNQLADKHGVIAVYPKAMHGEWNIGVRPEQPSAPMARRGGGRRGGWGEEAAIPGAVAEATLAVAADTPGAGKAADRIQPRPETSLSGQMTSPF